MISHVFCAADRGKAIFIGATKEHTGKTSVSMALIAGLVRRYRCIRSMYTVTLLSPSLARRCRFYNDDIITATYFSSTILILIPVVSYSIGAAAMLPACVYVRVYLSLCHTGRFRDTMHDRTGNRA